MMKDVRLSRQVLNMALECESSKVLRTSEI